MLGLLVRGVVGGSRAEQWGLRSRACPPFSIEIQFRISVPHRVAHPTGFALVLKQRLERSVADDLRSILQYAGRPYKGDSEPFGPLSARRF